MVDLDRVLKTCQLRPKGPQLRTVHELVRDRLNALIKRSGAIVWPQDS
jgi:hypothetical protein